MKRLHLFRFVPLLVASALGATISDALALGGDHPIDRPVVGSTNWPGGLEALVNSTNRIHGFFVNQEDTFFYRGDAPSLSAFLHQYARLDGVTNLCLIQHTGIGEAKSPWATNGVPCDWKLYACPKSWLEIAKLSLAGTNSTETLQRAAKMPGYVVEVHLWTGGRISLDELEIPKKIEVRTER